MLTVDAEISDQLPGGRLRPDKMPGHWLLARLGKRVLRPGGLAMTQSLLAALAIGADDDVVELAPGLGLTARLILGSDRAPIPALSAIVTLRPGLRAGCPMLRTFRFALAQPTIRALATLRPRLSWGRRCFP